MTVAFTSIAIMPETPEERSGSDVSDMESPYSLESSHRLRPQFDAQIAGSFFALNLTSQKEELPKRLVSQPNAITPF